MFVFPATVKRLTYTGDKSVYGAVAGTIYGHFAPVDPDQRPQAAQIGAQVYMFVCSGEKDIRATDIVTVNSIDYHVRGVRRYTLESLDFLDCLIELPVKN
jgi:hypothetical protein